MSARAELLLAVGLVALVLVALGGCASAPQPAQVIVQPRPPLDQALARRCELPPAPADLADFDAVDDWLMHQLLPAFADCARRHAAIVQAWGGR